MSQILNTAVVVGIDIGKNSCHIVGLDSRSFPQVLAAPRARGVAEQEG